MSKRQNAVLVVACIAVMTSGCRSAASSAPRVSPAPTAVPQPSAGAPATVSAQGAQAAPAPLPNTMVPQNPSPMQERIRVHERLEQPRRSDNGVHFSIDSVFPRPIEVFIPQRALAVDSAPLIVHFMGATWVPQRAVALMKPPAIVAAIFLGSGSSTYARPFAADTLLYGRMLDSITARIAQVSGAPRISRTYLSGWSAGYGAIREVLRRPEYLPRVDGVLLLDGIHTSYIPDRKVLADGGVLDTAGLSPFASFARLAVNGSKRFIITHTEIFPGSFASTTECTDWVLDALGLKRSPVLEWGPMGSQLISRTQQGRFEALAFAGNSAPDHVDLFHGMGTFIERLIAP